VRKKGLEGGGDRRRGRRDRKRNPVLENLTKKDGTLAVMEHGPRELTGTKKQSARWRAIVMPNPGGGGSGKRAKHTCSTGFAPLPVEDFYAVRERSDQDFPRSLCVAAS